MKNFSKGLASAGLVCYCFFCSIYQEYPMVVAYRRPSVDFFTNCYRELTEAHENGATVTAALYRGARPDIERWLLGYWRYRWNRIHFVTIEDLIQEGFESIAKYMKRYRYRCPVCDYESKEHDQYDNHCMQEHGVKLAPVTALSVYLSLNAMGRMRNVMRDLLKERRGVLETVLERDLWCLSFQLSGFVREDGKMGYRYIEIHNDFINKSTPYHETLSRQRMERFFARLEKEPSEKVKVYFETMLDGGIDADACRKLVELGLNNSVASANRILCIFKKSKKFGWYCKDLQE